VERLSLWRFADNRFNDSLRRPVLRQQQSPTTRVASCTGTMRSAYFEAIERERVVEAHDAQNDARTSDSPRLSDPPHGIWLPCSTCAAARQHDRRRTLRRSTSAAPAPGPSTSRTSRWPSAIDSSSLSVEEERQHALAQLADSEARARLIVETAHEAFIGIDSEGKVVAWNAQAEATFGWASAEVVGSVWPRR
jgi:PAS domain-containing protein